MIPLNKGISFETNLGILQSEIALRTIADSSTPSRFLLSYPAARMILLTALIP
jgi:hypothetical protein